MNITLVAQRDRAIHGQQAVDGEVIGVIEHQIARAGDVDIGPADLGSEIQCADLAGTGVEAVQRRGTQEVAADGGIY